MSDTRISSFARAPSVTDVGRGGGRDNWSPAYRIADVNNTRSSEGNQPLLREAVEISVAQQFTILAEQWHNESGAHSSMTLRKEHPAYGKLFALGPSIVPMLLEVLVTKPDLWFPLLRDITGENPVPLEERGVYDLMVERWRAWGRGKGLLN
jgi:hypothetical protein